MVLIRIEILFVPSSNICWRYFIELHSVILTYDRTIQQFKRLRMCLLILPTPSSNGKLYNLQSYKKKSQCIPGSNGQLSHFTKCISSASSIAVFINTYFNLILFGWKLLLWTVYLKLLRRKQPLAIYIHNLLLLLRANRGLLGNSIGCNCHFPVLLGGPNKIQPNKPT